jgi:hypothetical protein
MTARVNIPVKRVGTENWGALAWYGETHDICGEKVHCVDEKFSFAGQHRVRLFRFKKNVHWRIPAGVTLDITAVRPATPPPRRFHHKS